MGLLGGAIGGITGLGGSGGGGGKLPGAFRWAQPYIDAQKAQQAGQVAPTGAAAPATGGSWFDQQRVNIPSADPRSQPAPIPGGGSLSGLSGGQTIQPIPGQQVAPLGTSPAAGAPPAGTQPMAGGTPSSLAGYTGSPLKVDTQFNPQSFVNSDAYNFIKDQGLQGIERGAAAKGTLLTGGTQKDLAQFAGNNAATFYGTQLAHDTDVATGNANRTLSGLNSLSGYGLNAAQGQAGYGMEGGNAAAGGTIGQANAVQTGVSSAADSLAKYFAQRKLQQQTPAGMSPGGVLN